jgi:hypothetical protein
VNQAKKSISCHEVTSVTEVREISLLYIHFFEASHFSFSLELNLNAKSLLEEMYTDWESSFSHLYQILAYYRVKRLLSHY